MIAFCNRYVMEFARIVRSKVTSILKRHNSIECNLRPWE